MKVRICLDVEVELTEHYRNTPVDAQSIGEGVLETIHDLLTLESPESLSYFADPRFKIRAYNLSIDKTLEE
jgi:hypothetical protein